MLRPIPLEVGVINYVINKCLSVGFSVCGRLKADMNMVAPGWFWSVLRDVSGWLMMVAINHNILNNANAFSTLLGFLTLSDH